MYSIREPWPTAKSYAVETGISFIGSPNRSRDSRGGGSGGGGRVSGGGERDISRSTLSETPPRFKTTSPTRPHSPLALSMLGMRDKSNYLTPTPTQSSSRRRSSSAPPRSNNNNGNGILSNRNSSSSVSEAINGESNNQSNNQSLSQGQSHSMRGGGGNGGGNINLKWASKSLADFIGTKNLSVQPQSQSQSQNNISVSSSNPMRSSVDSIRPTQNNGSQNNGSSGFTITTDFNTRSNSSNNSGRNTTSLPNEVVQPSILNGISNSNYNNSPAAHRTFSLRKSVPGTGLGQNTASVVFGGSSSGINGNVRMVTGGAPYAVTIPDQ